MIKEKQAALENIEAGKDMEDERLEIAVSELLATAQSDRNLKT